MGIGRHIQIAARYSEIGLGCGQQRKTLRRAIRRDGGKPDRTSLPGKGLRQRLDQFLIVASRGAYCNTQGLRPQGEIEGAGRRDENKYSSK